MKLQTRESPLVDPHYAGPQLGFVAIVFVLLKIANVVPVSAFGIPFGVQRPFFPGLNAPIDHVATYFGTHPHEVMLCAFRQVGSAIPLGIFFASMASFLRLLQSNPTATTIALFGGITAATDEAMSGAILWVMGHPVIAQVPALTQTFHYLAVPEF